MVAIRTRYDASRKVAVDFSKCVSKTIQSAMKECDINFIMKRYEKTGLLVDPVSGASRKPVFGDFTGFSDYHSVCARVAALNSAFECLPARVRSKFDNDPGNMVNWLADPKNKYEAVKLGILAKSELKPEDMPKPADKPDSGTPPASGVPEGGTK